MRVQLNRAKKNPTLSAMTKTEGWGKRTDGSSTPDLTSECSDTILGFSVCYIFTNEIASPSFSSSYQEFAHFLTELLIGIFLINSDTEKFFMCLLP